MGKKPKASTTTLYVVYTQTRTGGEVCSGEEGAPFPNREPTYYENSFNYVLRSEPKDYSRSHDSLEVSSTVAKCSELYLAVVYYQTGDTFGSSYGNVHLLGAFITHQAAEAALKEALDDPERHAPWEGHFNRFEGSDIKLLQVRDR